MGENCTHDCCSCTGCGHDHEHDVEEMETGILTFVDDEGNDVRFEILDVVTLDEKEYLVVLPVDETEIISELESTEIPQ